MNYTFDMAFTHGGVVVAKIAGVKETNGAHLTIEDLQRLPEVQAFLERLLGVQVQIDSQAA